MSRMRNVITSSTSGTARTLTDHAAAFAEADARQAVALAVRAQDDLVAVFEELAAQLEQASRRLLLGAGDRAAGEEIAGLQVAAIRGVMRDELRDRPIHVAEVAAADPCAVQPDFYRDVERDVVFEMRQHRIFALRLHAIRLERVERDDPRRDRRRKVLREKRTERLVLPRLDVARQPVVDETEAEDVIERVPHRNRIAEGVAAADEDAQLQFVVEALRGTEDRRRIRIVARLSAGTFDRRAADDDRRRAAVIAD